MKKRWGKWAIILMMVIAIWSKQRIEVHAQEILGLDTIRAQSPYSDGDYLDDRQVPGLGHPKGQGGGFFGDVDFMFMQSTKAIGEQAVAFRGLFDTTGILSGALVPNQGGTQTLINGAPVTVGNGTYTSFTSGAPGTFIGPGSVALSTAMLTRSSYEPGMKITLGYQFDDGQFAVYASYLHLFEAHSQVSASLIPPMFQSPGNLSADYLTAPVFNFPTNYAGPTTKTPYDGNVIQQLSGARPTGLNYGIWNGASEMALVFTQRFDTFDLTGRFRAYSSETANVYGLAGGRFAWFWEQLKWRTTALDVNGNGTPSWTADYSNVLSQRMYGPFAGAGSDVYLGHGFSANFDATGALLLDFVKTIPKYWLEDLSIAKKVTRNSYEVVPNVNLGVNLLWNPFKNVQVRVGYQAMLFFNTKYMATPIDFNYGSLDPGYSNYFLRVVQGLNVGVGFMF